MNDIIILSEWTSTSGLGCFMLIFGLMCFVLFAWIAIFDKEDLSNNWFCAFVIGSIIGLILFIGSFFVPEDHGYKITLSDDAKFSEVVEHYNIIEIDGLILKVTEKTEDVVNGKYN